MKLKIYQNIPILLLIFAGFVLLPVTPSLYAQNFEDTKPFILIDPGHGGKDNGATGLTGLKEKDFNLYLAFALKNRLKKDFKVALTRSSDYYSGINFRSNQANTNKSNIFISIHAGSLFSQTETDNFFIGYYFDSAQEESIATIHNINKSHLKKNQILADFISDTLKKENKVIVARAPYMLLGSIDMPAIIIEADNLRSPEGSIRLKDPDYIEKTAYLISEGIKKYFKNTVQ